eukprot:CAMPEP_0168436608 /NCGR_PEP_ID=MMETSP0228-20121227/41012_1 /TAXON_ID=133427 /ORGANISM="Protoceratium reticulatum, Strain CCCM 535 (=CCMP 1889)" /LENGTH=48 /DNA_ID= /DNA_START= /DNA_END= /DNA_ORIENTATION=
MTARTTERWGAPAAATASRALTARTTTRRGAPAAATATTMTVTAEAAA